MNFQSDLQTLAESFKKYLNNSGSLVHTSGLGDYNWSNWLWTGPKYRRAHLQIVDRFAKHKLYVLHCTIFPHFDNPAPIFGFDAVCGPNKISGAFYDFSPTGEQDHNLIKWFAEGTSSCNWSKTRDLPDWARAIFSPYAVAASNIKEQDEFNLLQHLAILGIDTYLSEINNTAESGNNYYMAQNRYCSYQKKNPYVVNSMVAMGTPKETMIRFVNDILFPEVE